MLISNFKVLEQIVKPVKAYNLYHFKSIEGFSFDSRSLKKGQVFIAIRGKYQDGHNFIPEAVNKGASLIIAEKDLSSKHRIPFFIVENSYTALKRIAAYVREEKKPLVYGITGSIGKTTTKEILGFLLEKDFKVLKNYKTENNILGVSKTIFSLENEEVLVLELGTNYPGEIKTLAEICYPNIGIITFIKPVHLEGLKSLSKTFQEKSSLLKVNPDIKAVLNKDDRYLKQINSYKKIWWFGKENNCDLYARLIRRDTINSTFLIQNKFKLSLPVQFEGFIVNILAAILGAHLLKLPLEYLVERMNKFNDFPWGRMQLKQLGNLTILNDAYNANPYSFKQALKIVRRYYGRKIAIIGDMLELGEKSIHYHKLLAQDIIKSNFDYCLTMGDYTLYLKERLNELGYKNVFHFSSHQEISKFIEKVAKNGHLIFLKGSRKMELEKIIKDLQ